MALTSAQVSTPTIKRTAKVRSATSQASLESKDSLSQRTKLLNIDLTQNIQEANWTRTIYRQLDLTKESNAPLYYPTRTTDASQNLFAQIFKLLSNKRIVAYEYIDGEEVFTSEYKVQFKDLLDRFRINYTLEDKKGDKYHVANADIPSSEVKSYYIKETWFFDPTTSTYDVKIDAICPILYDLGEYGEVPMPLFWLPYEEIKPFISIEPVMLSSYNNKANATLDDFFRLGLYEGEIIKTKNLLGNTLAQSITSPDSIQVERKRIESELKDFGKQLFVQPSSSPTDSLRSEIEVKQGATNTRNINSRDKRIRSAKAIKQTEGKKTKAPKSQKMNKSNTSSGRSVRGRI